MTENRGFRIDRRGNRIDVDWDEFEPVEKKIGGLADFLEDELEFVVEKLADDDYEKRLRQILFEEVPEDDYRERLMDNFRTNFFSFAGSVKSEAELGIFPNASEVGGKIARLPIRKVKIMSHDVELVDEVPEEVVQAASSTVRRIWGPGMLGSWDFETQHLSMSVGKLTGTIHRLVFPYLHRDKKHEVLPYYFKWRGHWAREWSEESQVVLEDYADRYGKSVKRAWLLEAVALRRPFSGGLPGLGKRS